MVKCFLSLHFFWEMPEAGWAWNVRLERTPPLHTDIQPQTFSLAPWPFPAGTKACKLECCSPLPGGKPLFLPHGLPARWDCLKQEKEKLGSTWYATPTQEPFPCTEMVISAIVLVPARLVSTISPSGQGLQLTGAEMHHGWAAQGSHTGATGSRASKRSGAVQAPASSPHQLRERGQGDRLPCLLYCSCNHQR